MERMKQYLQRNKYFVILLVIVLLVHLVFLPGFHELWWDSGVYAGMGKYLFSAGSAGLWEHIRPPVLPAILGFLWFFGLDVQITGLILELLFSLGVVFFFYELTKHYFKEETALLASAIFSFSAIFFYLSFHLYTEVPAVFFLMLSLYVFVLKRYYVSGFCIAIAFLAKFPVGLFLPVLLLVLLLNKEIKNCFRLLAGFMTILLPVLVVCHFVYGNALLPFLEARQVILEVLGCNVLRFKPWWHYFFLIYSESLLHLFAFIGIIAFFADFRKKNLLPLFCLAAPLIYFSHLHCRDYRYLVVFIPFVAIFSALGLVFLLGFFRKYRKQAFAVILLLVLGFSIFRGVLFYIGNENVESNPAAEGYFRLLEGREISGEVWTSNPVIAFYTDAKLGKIYYPVYDGRVSTDFYNYLSRKSGSIEYVFLDNCGGGIICSPGDAVCDEKNKKLIDFLDSNFHKAYDEKYGECFYLVYKN